jgi:hypothetical protein
MNWKFWTDITLNHARRMRLLTVLFKTLVGTISDFPKLRTFCFEYLPALAEYCYCVCMIYFAEYFLTAVNLWKYY